MVSISPKIEHEVLSLPAHERIALIDLLIESLNLPKDPAIDNLWGEIAEKRLADISNGLVSPIQGNFVFSKIQSDLSK